MLLYLLLFGALCVSGLPSVATTPSSHIVSAFVSGFQTRRSKHILEALLANPLKESSPTENITIYKRYEKDSTETSAIRVATIHDHQSAVAIPKGADLSMIFIDSADILNDNQVLQRFQACFRSLLPAHSQPSENKNVAPLRRPFIIVFTGSVASAQHLEYLLNEAWLLLDPEELNKNGQMYSTIGSSSLFKMFDIQIILTPNELPPSNQRSTGPMLNPAAIKAVSKAINNVARSANGTTLASILDAINTSTTNEQANQTQPITAATAIPHDECQGMELASAAMRISLNKALLMANSSATGLSTFSTAEPTAFASLVTELVANATHILREYAHTHATHSIVNTKDKNSTDGGVISASALRWAENELCHQLYVRFLPLYKRQVQTLKAVAANDFNRRVSPGVRSLFCYIL